MKIIALVLLTTTVTLGSVATADALGQSVAASAAAAPASATAAAVSPRDRPSHRADRNCLRSTGSRLPAKPGHCLSQPGRSYSGREIRRTGENNPADALRMLDPAAH